MYLCSENYTKTRKEIITFTMRKELEVKVERAIKLIQSASKIAIENGCPEIEICYSSGKDSDVILELTKMANVPYRAIYKNTTIDASGTIKHAIEMGAEVLRPKVSFFKLVERMGLPNMRQRFCCRFLKEYKVLDYAIVGIRRSESRKRAERYKEPEQCRVYSKTEKVRQYFPILDWTDADVSEFIKERGVVCHPLYYDDRGVFHAERRCGCMGCCMTDKVRIEQFKAHPNLVKAYARALRKFRESHPDAKVVSMYKDEYEQLARDIFYWRKSNEEYTLMQENTILPPPNYKELLEDYFKIKFNEKS